MNFIEAINSGKGFKPVGSKKGYIFTSGKYLFGESDYVKDLDFYNSEFETLERKTEITESQFDKIVKSVVRARDRGIAEEIKKEMFKHIECEGKICLI